MGIGDDRSGSLWQQSLGKTSGSQHRAFDVDMGINEARGDVFSVQIDFLVAVIVAKACDMAVRDSEIPLTEFAVESEENPGITKNKICGFLTVGNAYQMVAG